jgi:hypothetical protein
MWFKIELHVIYEVYLAPGDEPGRDGGVDVTARNVADTLGQCCYRDPAAEGDPARIYVLF